MGLRTRLSASSTVKPLETGDRYLTKGEESIFTALSEKYGTTECKYRRGAGANAQWLSGDILELPIEEVKNNKFLNEIYKLKVDGKANRTRVVLIDTNMILSFVRLHTVTMGAEKSTFVQFEFHDANGEISGAVMEKLEKWYEESEVVVQEEVEKEQE